MILVSVIMRKIHYGIHRVTGHVQKPQKPVCSHGSDLPGSEPLSVRLVPAPPPRGGQTVNCLMGRNILGEEQKSLLSEVKVLFKESP